MRTCVDCKTEIEARNAKRCPACAAEAKKRDKAKSLARLKTPSTRHKVRHCDMCFKLYSRQVETTHGMCPECKREEGKVRVEDIKFFRTPISQWLSGKPVTLHSMLER